MIVSILWAFYYTSNSGRHFDRYCGEKYETLIFHKFVFLSVTTEPYKVLLSLQSGQKTCWPNKTCSLCCMQLKHQQKSWPLHMALRDKGATRLNNTSCCSATGSQKHSVSFKTHSSTSLLYPHFAIKNDLSTKSFPLSGAHLHQTSSAGIHNSALYVLASFEGLLSYIKNAP